MVAALPPIVTAQDLWKRFGAAEVVRGISFAVERGGCVGLLGPNGAGKTTCLRMLLGLTRVTSGSLRLFDTPIGSLNRAQRHRIGLVPQDNNLDPDLSVAENLQVYGRYFGLPAEAVARRQKELLDFVQLAERAGAPVMQLSGGMKRRLIMARALIADPELVILDEPTTGLDPQARVAIWKQLIELRRRGVTLLLTTHYMDEAQRLCDRIIIIDQGRILDDGPPQTLIDRHVRGHVFEVRKPLPPALAEGPFDREDIGEAVLFYVAAPADLADALSGDTTYLHRPANLEDVFLRLTGRKLRDA